jgi:Bacterial protein of unknown function (DUF899)
MEEARITTPASEHLQVAGDGRLRHAEVAAGLADRCDAAAEPLDDLAANRVRKGGERIVSHFANYSGFTATERHRRGAMPEHKVGTRQEWEVARDELLTKEKGLTRRNDELAQERRELPWVPVEKEYVFETDDGRR